MKEQHRATVTHVTVAALLLVGAYVGIVDRLQQKLKTARSETATLTSQVREAEHFRDMIPDLIAAIKRADDESARIRRLGSIASDERSLRTRLMQLASRHEVVLDEVNPMSPSPGMTATGAPAIVAAASGRAIEHAIALSMSATATYDHLAAFLRGVQTELGYSAVKAIAFSPVADEHGLVRAVISTEHYAFNVTPPVAAADEGGKER